MNETTSSTPWRSAAGTGSRPPKDPPRALSTELRMSETSSRKPIPKTMESDRKRSLMKPQIPRPGFGSTSQIVFIESCNWPKTPDAATSRVTTPTTLARIPSAGFWALASISLTASAPSLPTSSRICVSSCPDAASSPKTMPATAMAMISSGASESTL